MKAKSFLKMLSTAIVTGLVVAGMALPAIAGTTYTPVAGTTTTLKKYLKLDQTANVPNATIQFTVTAGTAIPAAPGKMEVLAGLQPGDVTVEDAVFASTDTKLTAVAQGDIITLGEGEAYVVKTLTANFTSVNFPEPGVYRYIITEEDPNVPGMNIDPQPTRTLDVYIVDDPDNEGTLKVLGYVLHTDTDAPDANATMGTTADSHSATKSDGFTNTYGTRNLWVGKTVTGNQGSRDKYFAITVVLTGLGNGTVLDVLYDGATTDPVYGNADASIAANPNAATTVIPSAVTQPTQLTADASGEVTQTFYLQHGQHFVICGIPVSATYTVTENAEDYKSAAGASSLNFNDNTSGTIATADVKTGYTNTRDGVIPTGVLLTAVPVIVVGLIAVAGVAFFAVRNARRKAQDDVEAAEE
ncbi:MAG: hypothetical protein J6Y08_00570 [Clostridiales bacterium]|nr:hypothetical protein [Clostridiales bacterium]